MENIWFKNPSLDVFIDEYVRLINKMVLQYINTNQEWKISNKNIDMEIDFKFKENEEYKSLANAKIITSQNSTETWHYSFWTVKSVKINFNNIKEIKTENVFSENKEMFRIWLIDINLKYAKENWEVINNKIENIWLISFDSNNAEYIFVWLELPILNENNKNKKEIKCLYEKRKNELTIEKFWIELDEEFWKTIYNITEETIKKFEVKDFENLFVNNKNILN